MERRYRVARSYWIASLVAASFGGVSAMIALEWPWAWLPTGFLLVSAAFSLWLALRPPVEVHTRWLKVGSRKIFWDDIERVEATGWVSPLVLRLRLASGEQLYIVYPGELETATQLVRDLRRKARRARLDLDSETAAEWVMLPGADSRENDARRLPSPRYRIVSKEDEEEIEQLYHRLKTVGYLDPLPGRDEANK